MENTTQLRNEIVELAKSRGEPLGRIPRATFVEVIRENHGLSWSVFNAIASNRVARGFYSLATTAETPSAPAAVAEEAPAIKNLQGVQSVSADAIYVPPVDKNYVPWGAFTSIKSIIASNMFYPVFISGHSGNGKTVMVEQSCAKAKREYVRVQLGPETDEDDLIGGFRLIDGETVFQKGPVIRAMERGSILLLDECDRVSNKVMCLQGVLEGKPVLIKKTGEVIEPAAGFTVIATANTKGRGDDDGRYSSATIIDDAFLERFVATFEQDFPSLKVEMKILNRFAEHLGMMSADVTEFVEKLCGWAQVIRKTYKADGIDETISTRRLVHIVKTFSIFNDRSKSIELCVNRFDEDTRSAFLDLYSKVDSNAVMHQEEGEEPFETFTNA